MDLLVFFGLGIISGSFAVTVFDILFPISANNKKKRVRE